MREQPGYAEAWSALGLIDARLDRKADALREGRRACELLPISKDAWDGPAVASNLAAIYAWTGERDLAIQTVGSLARTKGGDDFTEISYGGLKLDPRWEPLRADPPLPGADGLPRAGAVSWRGFRRAAGDHFRERRLRRRTPLQAVALSAGRGCV